MLSALDSAIYCPCMCHVVVFLVVIMSDSARYVLHLFLFFFLFFCFLLLFFFLFCFFILISLTSQPVNGHLYYKLLCRRLLWAHCSSETGMVRGEASHDATVPVPGKSVNDDSRVPSHDIQVCMMVATSFCLTSLLSVLLIILGHT